MRTIFAVLIPLMFLLVMTAGELSAQTDTPEPTPVPTSTSEPYRYEVIDDQTVRYDYIITAGEVVIGGLLIVLVLSVWLIGAIFYLTGGGKRG